MEKRLVSELIPYARNARTHSEEQVAQIAASIREFGWTNPVLIDGKNGVIAGHGRLLAARKLGVDEVPVIELSHLTPAQKQAYILADNKLAMNAGWDDELLAIELGELQSIDFDMGLTGFSDEEIAALQVEEIPSGLTDEDAVPSIPVDPTTKFGDVWLLGKHRLMCGDSTSIDAVDVLMGGHKADMVFTDPPYGVDYNGINNDSRAGLADLLSGAFACMYAASKSGAACYVFHSDRCADVFHTEFRKHFHFSSMVIWAKNSLTLSRTDYQSQHEPCLYGWMKDGTHTFYGDRKQTSLWYCSKERVEGHTTPKPVEIIKKALSNSSKGGDVVLDLFGGSGSTLVACEKTGREARLMELDPKYCDVIVKRWQEFTGKTATLEATGQPFQETSNA